MLPSTDRYDVSAFKTIASCSTETAQFYMQAMDGRLDEALNYFYDTGGLAHRSTPHGHNRSDGGAPQNLLRTELSSASDSSSVEVLPAPPDDKASQSKRGGRAQCCAKNSARCSSRSSDGALGSRRNVTAGERRTLCKGSVKAKVKAALRQAEAADGDDVVLYEESPEADDTNVALYEESPEADDTNVALYEERPEADDTNVALYEERPEADDTNVALYEERPEADATNVALYEESPEADGTNGGQCEESSQTDDTIVVLAEESPEINDDEVGLYEESAEAHDANLALKEEEVEEYPPEGALEAEGSVVGLAEESPDADLTSDNEQLTAQGADAALVDEDHERAATADPETKGASVEETNGTSGVLREVKPEVALADGNHKGSSVAADSTLRDDRIAACENLSAATLTTSTCDEVCIDRDNVATVEDTHVYQGSICGVQISDDTNLVRGSVGGSQLGDNLNDKPKRTKRRPRESTQTASGDQSVVDIRSDLRFVLQREMVAIREEQSERSESPTGSYVMRFTELRRLLETLDEPGWGSAEQFLTVFPAAQVGEYGERMLLVYRRFRAEHLNDVIPELSNSEKRALADAAEVERKRNRGTSSSSSDSSVKKKSRLTLGSSEGTQLSNLSRTALQSSASVRSPSPIRSCSASQQFLLKREGSDSDTSPRRLPRASTQGEGKGQQA